MTRYPLPNRWRTPVRVAFAALILAMSWRAAWAQCNEWGDDESRPCGTVQLQKVLGRDCTVSLLNRIVPVGPQGIFAIDNVPGPVCFSSG